MNAEYMPIMVAACLGMATAQAQMSLESEYRCTGEEMMRVFEPQRQALQLSSALVIDGREEAGYGVVVSPQGHILVKASEFAMLNEPEVIVDRKRYKEVQVVASDQDWDVSLIKVDAEGLVPVEFAPTSDVATGTWVVTNGATSRLKRRLLMGVISARAREIPPLGGLVLGVVIHEAEGQLEVKEVSEGGGAAAAGILAGDLLLGIGEVDFKELKDLTHALKGHRSGDKVAVRVGRDGGEQRIEVVLGTRDETYKSMSRNDQMSGDFSLRRSDFPRALQHSILGNSKSVGGPLLDLDGRCLGMNIARANRAESYAIPTEELKALMARLMDRGAAGEAR